MLINLLAERLPVLQDLAVPDNRLHTRRNVVDFANVLLYFFDSHTNIYFESSRYLVPRAEFVIDSELDNWAKWTEARPQATFGQDVQCLVNLLTRFCNVLRHLQCSLAE